MAHDTDEVNREVEQYLSERMEDKSRELYQRNALGDIVAQLYPGYGDFFAVPLTANHEFFELLSVFVKRDRDTFEYVGSLRRNGGILSDESTDLLHILRPHLHSSSKKHVDRYLMALKPPFTRTVSEFLVDDLVGRPEGKYFSWLDLGSTQIEYVDPVKLTARLNNLRVGKQSLRRCGKTCIYVVYKVLCYDDFN